LENNTGIIVSPGKELENIALAVLSEYGIIPGSLSLIQGGNIKTVWKVKAQGNWLCLKRLKQTPDKATFSVYAQIYIKSNGGKVPGIILNKNNSPITIYNEQVFVLYEWIDGKDLNLDVPSDLHHALRGLAGFHIASRGYCPDKKARVSSKLGKWPEQYTSMKNRLSAWREIARDKVTQPSYKAYFEFVEPVLHLADKAINELAMSKYAELTREDSPSIVLCHQDFGKGNALDAPDGIYVLDLDGVTFDLPARDLRKIIGKNAENRGQWQTGAIRDIIDCYCEVNPLGFDDKQVLYIDLLFPHWFFGLVKNLFQNGKPLKASEIERMAKFEVSKIPFISSLIKSQG